jgi:hypothetical protein
MKIFKTENLKTLLIRTSQYVNNRDRPRFLDQVGHQTIYAYIGNKHFFTKSCHRQTYQNYEQPPQRMQNLYLSKSFFSIKNQLNLSDFFSMKNIRLGDQLFEMKFFDNYDF